jgi:peptidoglycan hydrolase-like protein with peptidoglycan-binding domain
MATDYEIDQSELLEKWSSFTGLKKKAPKVNDEGPTVKELKTKLKSLGLKVGGKKSELKERLAAFDRGELRPVVLDTAKAIADGDYSKMTVKMLKEELKSKGLKVSGKKDDLVARLSNSDDDDEDVQDEPADDDYNHWTVKKIREELKTRGLKAKKGDKKIDLIAILDNDDKYALSNREVEDSDSEMSSDEESDIEETTEA